MRGACFGKQRPITKKLALAGAKNCAAYPRGTKGELESQGQNKCGPGQPPEPHRSWISPLAFSPLGTARRRYRSNSAHQECHFYQYQLQNVIRRITAPQPLRWPPAQPVQRAGEEAAMPGQPARARARFRMSPGNSPSRIASLPPASPQSSFNKTESSHVVADSAWGRMPRTATKKHFALVQKLWRMRVPCGRLRKSENQIALRESNPSVCSTAYTA
jgi:hypothetical protein